MKASAEAPPIDFDPIPARLALPTRVLQMRLPAEAAGTYIDRELSQPVPLRAVGLNLCQTGWVLQGFLEDESGLRATPAIAIPQAVLPIGPTTIRNRAIPGQALELDLKEGSPTRLRGTVRISSDAGGADLMRMDLDATPIGVSVAPGLGPQGCFTTGYYQLRTDDEQRVGPLSAVWDQKRLHYVGLRLTDRYGIGVWMVLEPTHRQPQNIIRGDLATVGEKPKRFPFRVVFETRNTTADGVSVDETPATAGKLTASFLRANPQGPLRIELDGLQFPDWDGPLAGRAVDVRLEALLVTDLDGVGVPVPAEPNFEQETTRRLEQAPGAVRVAPDSGP